MRGKDLNINFYGCLFSIGLILQIVSSAIWQELPQKFTNEETLGEWVYMVGQGIGISLWLVCIMKFLKPHKIFWLIAGFGLDLSLLDLWSILFMNPFEKHLSKTVGFCIASLVLLIRLKYRNKNAT